MSNFLDEYLKQHLLNFWILLSSRNNRINFYLFLSDNKNIVGNLLRYSPLHFSQLKNMLDMFHLEFHKGVNASIAAKSIQSTYEDYTLNERSCRSWF